MKKFKIIFLTAVLFSSNIIFSEDFITAQPKRYDIKDYSKHSSEIESDIKYYGENDQSSGDINIESTSLKRLGITNLKHLKSKILSYEKLYIDFNASKDALFLVNLYKNNQKLENRASIITTSTGVTRVILFFPEPGDYYIWIFGKLKSDAGSYPGIIRYDINAKSGIDDKTLNKIKNDEQNQFLENSLYPFYIYTPEKQKSLLNEHINKNMNVYSIPIYESQEILSQNSNSVAYAYLSSDGASSPELCFDSNNNMYLGYNNKDSNLRIIGLNRDLSHKENCIIFPGRRLEALNSFNDGLVSITSSMGEKSRSISYITAWNNKNELLFDSEFIGTSNYDNVGNQGYGDYANVVWTGNEFVGLSTTYRKWPDNVVHQGDYLRVFEKNGEMRKDKGWYWGVSHSFRPLMINQNNEINILTGGDAYPRGFAYRKYDSSLDKITVSTKVLYEVSGKIGDNDANHSMGGAVLTENGTTAVFDGKEGLDNYEIFMVNIDKNGIAEKPIRLTYSTKEGDRVPKIAKFGDNFFIAWAKDTEKPINQYTEGITKLKFIGAVVTSQGKFIYGPTELKVNFRGRTKFFNYPDGAVGWISDTSEFKKLNLVYLKTF